MPGFSTGRNLAPNHPGDNSRGSHIRLLMTTEFSFTETETTLSDGAACTTVS